MKWESPDCELCGTSRYLQPFHSGVTTFEYPGEFGFVRCSNCGLVFQSPRVPASQVGQYYPPETYWGGGKPLSNHRYNRMYQAIQKYHPSPGKILDIGTGIGLFLTKFQELGWQVEGTEISKESAAFARRQYHVPVHVGMLEDLKLPASSFDVIVLNHVLEHLYHPKQVLAICRQLLKKDGLLVIALPNISGLGHFIFRRHWYAMQPGRHVYHFSPGTMYQLLRQSQFQLLKIILSDYIHDQYTFFQSIRYLKSRPVSMPANHSSIKTSPAANKFSPKAILSIIANLLASIVALFEKFTKTGDVMIVVARPSHG